MDETIINAKFAALITQRNDAQNTIVNLMGEIASLQARIKELETQVTTVEELNHD